MVASMDGDNDAHILPQSDGNHSPGPAEPAAAWAGTYLVILT